MSETPTLRLSNNDVSVTYAYPSGVWFVVQFLGLHFKIDMDINLLGRIVANWNNYNKPNSIDNYSETKSLDWGYTDETGKTDLFKKSKQSPKEKENNENT